MSEGRKVTPLASSALLASLMLVDRYHETRKHVLHSRTALMQIIAAHRGQLLKRRALFAYGGRLFVEPGAMDEFLLQLGEAKAAALHDAGLRNPLTAEIEAKLRTDPAMARDGFTQAQLLRELGYTPELRTHAVKVAAGFALRALGFVRTRASLPDDSGTRPWVYKRRAQAGQVISIEGSR